MVFHDRVMILVDGPLTAVAAFRASAAERASAYPRHDAAGVIERIRRDAEGGDRQSLVDMFQLIYDPGLFGLHRIPTAFFVTRVLEAVIDGRLLLVPGWKRTGADASPIRQQEAPEHHVVRRVMKDQQHLAFEGEKYFLIPAEAWTGARRSGRHEVVPREKAEDVLQRLAAHSAFSDRKSALDEARSAVADTRTPNPRGRLFLLRHVERRVASAGGSTGPAATPSKLHRHDPHTGTDMGQLVVRVRSPVGAGIAGVTVDVPGLGVLSTGADGRANFGSVPASTYQVQAKQADHGPVPSGGGTFAIGEATASQAVVAAATSTVELQMTTVTSVKISHTPAVAATPLRIYKVSAMDVHVDHLVTCAALCPRTTGSGPGTQVPVRVEWTFTADAGNAPKSKGGKDKTDIHFGAAPGHGMSGAGTSSATTVTDDSGQTQILFRAPVTSGDRFTVHAKVLRDAGNPAAGDVGHDDSPRFEVWKRLDYRNLYRMQTGANLGFDLASHCTASNIQPAFTPTFTEYSVGAPTAVPYREYITALVAPTAAQLPLSGRAQIRSDGPDARMVVVAGLVVAADGSTTPGTESLTLLGTSAVSGTKLFQKIVSVALPPSPSRSVSVGTSSGAPVCVVGPRQAGRRRTFCSIRSPPSRERPRVGTMRTTLNSA